MSEQTEQEEFEFRLRLENEQSGLVKAEEVPFVFSGMADDQKPPTMSQYLLESAGRGLTSTPARLAAGSAMQTGTFAGAFPSQPELEAVTTQSIQRGLGLQPQMRPATGLQRYLGAAVEGATDVTGLFGKGKALSAITGGMAGLGGEFGGEVGQQVAGTSGQVIGGLVFSLLSGGGTAKGGQMLFDKASDRFNIKDLDVADLANVEGISRAKDLTS